VNQFESFLASAKKEAFGKDNTVTSMFPPEVGPAVLATTAIGILPIFILAFIPLVKEVKDGKETKQTVNEPLLKTLLSFAVGGLLGDVFLHLLPHAIEPHSDSGIYILRVR
jgi:hypothetical protein